MNRPPQVQAVQAADHHPGAVVLRRWLIAGIVVAAAAVAVPNSLASAPSALERAKTKRVLVADDYFAPTSVNVKKRNKVNFKWDGSNTNPHNVTLTKGPRKVKKKDFTSATGSIGIRFNPTFKKPGTYNFICTIHPGTMKVTVKVKK